MRVQPWWVLAAGLVLASLPAAAAELGQTTDGLPTVEMHGFVSQGAIKTTHNNYLVASERGSLDFTEMGANFSLQMTDRLRVGLQLFSSKLGTTGNFSVKADWFNLDYRWKDWLGLRAGRVKLPFGLYNDTSDIDAARVPVLLPQSVYPISERDFLLAQTGFELYGFISLEVLGALEYRLYAGSVYIPLTGQAPGPVQVTGFNAQYVLGGRLLWDTPLEGLRVGGSVQDLRFDLALHDSPPVVPADTTVTSHLSALLGVASAEYVGHDWLVASEYSRWQVKVTDSSSPMLLPNYREVSERFYALVAYRLRRWLQPGAYYSRLAPNLLVKSGAGATQHDVAGTLRFDINDFWLVKLEGHFMHGTADLNPQLNGGTRPTT